MDLPAAPKTQGKVIPKIYSQEKIEEEAERLINTIKQPERWTLEHCKTIAAYTLEINELKKKKMFILSLIHIKHQTSSME
jgi:hypothetical protein